MNELIIMCGLSASGKSTIAKELATKLNAEIISSDAIRKELTGNVTDQTQNEEVFRIFHKRIYEKLKSGISVIADATNITRKSRRAILERVKNIHATKCCIVIPKAYEDCLKDNIGREHPVPEDVIKRQMHRFEIPFIEEGFDKIKIWDLGNYKSIVPKYRYRDMVFMMYRFDQKNPHHKRNLLSHSTHTHNLFLKKTLGEFDSSCYFGSRLHDIGKLFTQVFDENGIAHYNQHPNVGSYFVLTRIMLPLAWDSHWNETEDEWFLNCCFLINYHMIPFHIQTDEQKEKYQRMFGEYKYKMLNDFHKCDISD